MTGRVGRGPAAEDEMPDDTRRKLNDDRRRIFGASRAIAFLCECPDEACRASVVLTPPMFDGLRAADELLLHPGHGAATPADAPPAPAAAPERTAS